MFVTQQHAIETVTVTAMVWLVVVGVVAAAAFFRFYFSLNDSTCKSERKIHKTCCNPCSMCANIAPSYGFFLLPLNWTRAHTFFVPSVFVFVSKSVKQAEKCIPHDNNKQTTREREQKRSVHNFDNANHNK